MKKKIIIEQPWGGLGDNLQFSTIPEVGEKLGYEVYVSNKNSYRNPEIKKLVWDLNPFIKGFTDENGNIDLKKYKDTTGNIISNWEKIIFGEAFCNKPNIYFTPFKHKCLFDITLIDPNSISSKIPFDDIIRTYDPQKTILLNYYFEGYKTYKMEDIFAWIISITSCKKFVCQYSGGSVAIRAFDKKATVYVSKNANRNFIFKENNNIFV